MASNFKIYIHRKYDRLHVRLTGDFDGMSACELLNILRDNGEGVGQVFVNTSGLKDVYSFGQDTFEKNLYLLKGRSFRLVFTGQKASNVAPERNMFF
ncbi:MAG: hypothetical protein JSV60_09190 [Desulfobacterales bacterium]|nr:MAG: hypothetical protein JSV60_09190 [Desulfobacterales bacterium]